MFKFTYDGEDNRLELTVEEEGLTHMDVAQWFNQFLRGSGYVYDGEYVLMTKEDERALVQYYGQKDRDAFIQSAFGDVADEDGKGTFPVI